MTESSLLAADAGTFAVVVFFKDVLLLVVLVVVDAVFEFASPLSQFFAIGLDLLVARVTVVGHLAAHLVQIGRVGRHKDTNFEKGINRPIHAPVSMITSMSSNAPSP